MGGSFQYLNDEMRRHLEKRRRTIHFHHPGIQEDAHKRKIARLKFLAEHSDKYVARALKMTEGRKDTFQITLDGDLAGKS